MKAMMLTGIREMEMREVPTPSLINDHDVLIRMKTLGVCGSDIHYYVSGKIGARWYSTLLPSGMKARGRWKP